MASILPNGKTQFVDQNGKPLVGGSVTFYVPGTTTKKDTWQDQAMTQPNTNPVILDSRGQATIWGSGAYRQVVADQFGAVIWDQVVTDISAAVTTLQSNLAASSGSSLVGFLQAGTGAVARTMQDKMRDVVSAMDFGAKGDGATDDTNAIKAFISFLLLTGRAGHLPSGTYKITSQITIDLSTSSPKGLKLFGDGQQTSILDASTVSASPAILITAKPDAQGAGFYSSFCDFAIRGNIAGTLLQLGPSDNSAALNAVEFRNLWVGNNNTSSSTVGIQVNYVLGSKFDNVVAANNHGGDSWQICAAAFCTWIGGAATWGSNGMRLTYNQSLFGTIAGNLFIGIDFEENVGANIAIDSANAHDNTWIGGTHVYTPGSTYACNATQGQNNQIKHPSINAGSSASFANFFNNKVGMAVYGVFGITWNNGPGNPAFNAYMSASQSPAAGAWTKGAFNSIDFQNGNSYDAATNYRYTCQTPGVHEFSVIVQVTATNASLATHQLALYRNGTALRTCIQNVAAGSNTITLQLVVQCTLSVGDYIEVFVNLAASSGSPTIGGGNASSYFSGALRNI